LAKIRKRTCRHDRAQHGFGPVAFLEQVEAELAERRVSDVLGGDGADACACPTPAPAGNGDAG